jgi:O-antigen ligase
LLKTAKGNPLLLPETAMPISALQRFGISGLGLLVLVLIALPLLSVIAPRALGFLPALAGFSGLALSRLAYGAWPRWPIAYLRWMALLLVLMVLSALWSIDQAETLERSMKALPVLLGGAALCAFMASLPLHEIGRLITWLPRMTLIGGVFLVLNLYFEGFLYSWMGAEPFARTIEAGINLAPLNRGVMVFAFFSILSAACLFQGLQGRPAKTERRAVVLMLGVLLILMLYQTHSQSAQLSIITALLVAAVFPYRAEKAWLALSALLAALVFAAPFVAQILYIHVAPIIADFSWFKNGYAAARFEIWNFISVRILESPFWGFGAEATRAMTFDHAQAYHRDNSVLHPHNFALQMWIEFGVLGAAFASGFLIWMIRIVKNLGTAQARLILPLLIACIAAAATSYGLWQGWWIGLFTLLAAYAQALARITSAAAEPAQS